MKKNQQKRLRNMGQKVGGKLGERGILEASEVIISRRREQKFDERCS